MQNAKTGKNSYSLVDNTKLFIFVAIVIICINIAISSFSILNIKQQNSEAIQNSVTFFQEETAQNLSAIQHFVQWTVLREPLVDAIEETTNDYEQFLAIQALQIRISNHQYATGSEFNYFMYLEDQDMFFNASVLGISYYDYLKIKKFVINEVLNESQVSFEWHFTEIKDKTYMYYLLPYENRTFAAFVNVDDLFASLYNMNLGKSGELVVTDAEDHIIISEHNHEASSLSSLFYTVHSFEGADNDLPYNLKLYSDNFHNYGKLFIFQLFVIITAIGICVLLSALIVNMYRKVIKPIQEFSTNLANINDANALIDFEGSRVLELEQTNLQFKKLLHEINNLKISIYESELEKKRFQITFLQHQIKPHFYLNVLTTISSMAQLESYKDIESMVLFTTRYLRYLFQTDKEFLRIEYELAHIQAYLDIQKLRLGSFFTYSCSIEEECENAYIPPLLLITFIENTIKHNSSTGTQLKIQLSVTKEQAADFLYLKIDIVDSGLGFSQDVLNNLSNGENLPSTEQSSHIGISNSIQRLFLLYGEKYKISFFNEKTGGAHIQLLIPYQDTEDPR